jgi:putrescine transport system substrate-binding protein
LTNELGYPTANKASLANVDAETAQNKAVFPDETNLGLMVAPAALGNATRESMTAVYTSFKKGK